MDSHHSCDILVVGAGVFGLTAAIELKSRHKDKKITVIDNGPIPHRHAASTDISKVIRMDYGDDELYVEMMEECFPIWRKWNQEWKEQVYFETGLVCVEDSEQNSYLDKTVHTLKKRGHEIQELDAKEMKKRFPMWGHNPHGYFNPLAGWARSGMVVENLNRIAIAAGVNVEHGTMDKLLLKPDNASTSICEGVLTRDGKQYRAPLVIVAAGASTPHAVPQVSHLMWPTAQPVFHVQIEEPANFPVSTFPVFFSAIETTGLYGFPIIEESMAKKFAPQETKLETLTHRLKIGTHGPGWRVNSIDDQTLSALWQKVSASEEKKIRGWLQHKLPALAKAKIVYQRLCCYCDSFDGNFVIDHVPTVHGLVVAAGGSGHGFKFAPILGNIIADVVEGKPNKFKARFAWRSVVAGQKESSRNITKPSQPSSLASL